MKSIRKFSVSLLHSPIKISFIDLCLVYKISIFPVFTILYYSDKYTFNILDLIIDIDLFSYLIDSLEMFMKTNLFSLETFRISFSKS